MLFRNVREDVQDEFDRLQDDDILSRKQRYIRAFQTFGHNKNQENSNKGFGRAYLKVSSETKYRTHPRPTQKLTHDQVGKIKYWLTKYSQNKVARLFKVNQTSIRNIVHGFSYRDVPALRQNPTPIRYTNNREKEVANPHEKLSKREYEIFIQLALGKPISIVSQELKISVNSGNTYRMRIMKKMSLRDNNELTQYAEKHNLIMIKTFSFSRRYSKLRVIE